ncbi:hypothetical protein HIM_00852 [Hirsutella minnesotensis 3608]|nr:hypothetical protein HIM_00852 [Hirsutella minnesotensis 3608]
MEIRTTLISASIANAVAAPDKDPDKKRILRKILGFLSTFFSIYKLHLARYRPDDFRRLRHDVWRIGEEDYKVSFRVSSGKNAFQKLKPVGDLGYSGSTFFATPNGKFLVKSLPRRFEHEFFTHDLLDSYTTRMDTCPQSLLVRIVDMVYTPRATLGGLLGTAPTHHIIMENVLFRGGDDDSQGGTDDQREERSRDVETYDLKPDNYFFPERDIADGRLAPDSVKDRLVDKFPGQVRVSAEAKQELVSFLNADTALLASASAVDYSLFLVRFPGPSARPERTVSPFADPLSPFADPPVGGSWRAGVDSTDGQWTYRAVVLDFFWAKKKLRAKAMTGLIDAFNVLAKKGPMSITAQPDEYRARFMSMIDKLVSGGDDDVHGPAP